MEYTTQLTTQMNTGEITPEDQSFDEFMEEQHMIENPTVLDDELSDSYSDWVSKLEPYQVLEYAEEYTSRNAKTFADDYCKANGII